MILDKPSHLPVRKKLALLSHVGVLHAAKEDGVGVTARGARIMVGIMNPYSPVQNAMCKRWDTPEITEWRRTFVPRGTSLGKEALNEAIWNDVYCREFLQKVPETARQTLAIRKLLLSPPPMRTGGLTSENPPTVLFTDSRLLLSLLLGLQWSRAGGRSTQDTRKATQRRKDMRPILIPSLIASATKTHWHQGVQI